MSPTFNKSISSPLEKEILAEEKNYELAFKSDAEFQVLKEIKTKINLLKAELKEQRMHLKKYNS
jgi:hypothetical protein